MSLDNDEVIDKLECAAEQLRLVMIGKLPAVIIGQSIDLIKEAVAILTTDEGECGDTRIMRMNALNKLENE